MRSISCTRKDGSRHASCAPWTIKRDSERTFPTATPYAQARYGPSRIGSDGHLIAIHRLVQQVSRRHSRHQSMKVRYIRQAHGTIDHTFFTRKNSCIHELSFIQVKAEHRSVFIDLRGSPFSPARCTDSPMRWSAPSSTNTQRVHRGDHMAHPHVVRMAILLWQDPERDRWITQRKGERWIGRKWKSSSPMPHCSPAI